MKKLICVLLSVSIIYIMAWGIVKLTFSVQDANDASEGKKYEMVTVYGQTMSKSTESVEIDSILIKDYEELSSQIATLDNLKNLDLGTYELTTAQREEIVGKFPGLNLNAVIYENVYGQKIHDTDTVIDCTKCTTGVFAGAGANVVTLNDISEITAALPNLPLVTKVDFGGKEIAFEELKELEAKFPEVSFAVKTTIYIGGKPFTNDAEKLNLSDVKLDKNFYEAFKYFYQLTDVDARNQDFTIDDKLEIVEACPNIKFLWEVPLSGNTSVISTDDKVDISKRDVDFDEIRKAIPLFYNLERIDVSYCNKTNEELAEFRAEIREKFGVEIAWRIKIGRWTVRTDQTAFSVLIYNYDYQRMTSADIEPIKYCDKLLMLDLGHQRITDISVICDNLPQLRLLILADNAIKDISPITQLKHLHYVEFFVNYIEDISPLGECKELVDVNIGWNQFSDVSALCDFPLLERIAIINTNMTKAGRDMIKEAYGDRTDPEVEMYFTGRNSVDCWRGHPRYKDYMDGWANNCLPESIAKYDGLVVKDDL